MSIVPFSGYTLKKASSHLIQDSPPIHPSQSIDHGALLLKPRRRATLRLGSVNPVYIPTPPNESPDPEFENIQSSFSDFSVALRIGIDVRLRS
jgi:hypothetical protein